MSNCMSGRYLNSLVLLFICWTGVNATTASTGHYSYTLSSTNMSVTCNDLSFPCTPTIDGVALAVGDEIAAVDSIGTCIGSAKWTGSTIAIPIMGYDPTAPGLKAGQKIQFRIWDASASVEIAVTRAHFAPIGSPMPTADSTYSVNGIAALDSLIGYSTPAAPILSLPVTASINQSITPTLSWNSVNHASSYGIQVSTGSSFATTIVNQSGITTAAAAVNGLNNSTKYYWRTNTTNVIATGAWSAAWNFTTIIDTPGVPTLSLPSNGAVNQLATLTLSWKTVTGAASYSLQVSTASDFASTVANQGGMTIAKNSISGLSTGTVYFWQINATNIGGTGTWSGVWSFTTIAIPVSPTLSSPTASAVNLPIALTLGWGSVSGAATYGVQLSTVSTFATTVVSQSSLTVPLRAVTGLLNNTDYYWQVNATNAGGTSNWSTAQAFTTIVAIPVAPALSLPTTASINQPTALTLNWSTVANAVSYGLQVSTVSTFASTFVSQSGITANAQPVSGFNNSTKCYWRVNATDVGGTGTWSGVWNFTTIIAIPGAPALSLPTMGAVNQLAALTLSWGSVTGAASYLLQVSTVSSFATTVVNQAGLTTLKNAVSGLSTGTGYFWHVNATNIDSTGAWSSLWSFTTIAIPASPTLSSPTNAAVNQPIALTLGWGSVSGAVSYAVQLSTVSTFATTVASQSSLTVPLRAVTGLLNNTAYYWQVNATNAGGTSKWSTAQAFTTIVAIPGAPALSLPTTASINQPVDLTLSWGTVTNAVSYALQVSTASTFATTMLNQTGIAQNSLSYSPFNNSAKYFWRVNATDVGGTGTWSAVWNFTTIIAIPGAPTLSLPAMGAVNQLAALTLSWSTLTGAASYALQVSTASDFASTVVSQSGLTTVKRAVSGLSTGTGYFWHVNATNVDSTGNWSSTWNFTTIAIPASPTLSSPTDAAVNQPIAVTLGWSSVSGAASYAIQLSTVSTFATTVVSQSALTVPLRAVTGLLNNTAYYWQVNATNGGGTANWSSVWTFTTIVAIPSAVVLSSPTTASINQPIDLTLNWGTVANAASYGLQVSTVSTFATTVVSQNGLTTNSQPPSSIANSAKYYWRVNSTDVGGTGTWSAVWNFMTIIDTPSIPTLSLPTNGAVNQLAALTMSWGTVTGAKSYSLQVSTGSDFASTVVNQSSLTIARSAISGLSTGTGYFWHINATNVGGTSNWTGVWSFTTIAIPASPLLSSPTTAAFNQPIALTLGWGSVSGAASYTVQLSTVSTFATTVVSQSALTVPLRAVTGLLNNTTYFWQANATNAGGTAAWSSVWTFTTIIAIPVAPTLSMPTTGAVNQPVSLTMTWNTVANAATYGLQISTVSTFATTVTNQSTITGNLQYINGMLANSTKYFWRINGTDAGGTGVWSAVWNFTTIIDTPSVPALSAPTNNALNRAIALTLSWGSITGASSYSLQVSTGSDFASTVVSQSSLTAVSRAITGLGNSTVYFWHVNAVNAGGTSAWAGVWSFTTIIAAPNVPVLSLPAAGAINQPTTLTMNWGTVATANTYTVQLSTVSTFATTVANQPGLTTATPTVAGLTRAVRYFWRVNATNAGGASVWSSVWDFTVSATGIVIGIQTGPMVIDNALLNKDPTVALRNTELIYTIYHPSAVGIAISDLRGRTTVLVNQVMNPGNYTIMLRNRLPAAGFYVLRFKSGKVDKVMKLIMRSR